VIKKKREKKRNLAERYNIARTFRGEERERERRERKVSRFCMRSIFAVRRDSWIRSPKKSNGFRATLDFKFTRAIRAVPRRNRVIHAGSRCGSMRDPDALSRLYGARPARSVWTTENNTGIPRREARSKKEKKEKEKRSKKSIVHHTAE